MLTCSKYIHKRNSPHSPVGLNNYHWFSSTSKMATVSKQAGKERGRPRLPTKHLPSQHSLHFQMSSLQYEQGAGIPSITLWQSAESLAHSKRMHWANAWCFLAGQAFALMAETRHTWCFILYWLTTVWCIFLMTHTCMCTCMHVCMLHLLTEFDGFLSGF